MIQGRYRALNTLLLIGATLIMAVASSLEPDLGGVGTHLQLGLEPCIFLTTWGLPCPACGWTTSFVLMAEGRVITSFINQPFGAFLSLITITLIIISASEAMKPRNLWCLLHGCFRGRETQVLSALLLALTGAWAYKITQNMIFLSAVP